MRRQTIPAARVEATLARAPKPASRPDQIKRLTKGLSVIDAGFNQTPGGGTGSGSDRPERSYPSKPRQIVSTINAFAASSSASFRGSVSKIHPVNTCSTQP